MDIRNCRCRQRGKNERRCLLQVFVVSVLLALTTVLILLHSPYQRYLPSYRSFMQSVLPRHKPRISSVRDVYICAVINGRVGNAFFFYMSILGIARSNNMTLLLQDRSVLRQVLEHPPESVAAPDFDKKCQDAWHLQQRRCCVLDERLLRLPHDDRYHFSSCLISWRYFERIKGEVKTRLEFRRDVLAQARGIIRKVKQRAGNRTTLVGMHIRRGDQSGWIAYWNGHNPVTPAYTTRAMQYFSDRFPHVHFVVASQDTDWCRKYVSRDRSDVTIMEGNSAAVDMAVLTLTDHMIVSIGTFGWWAGYLNPGIKTYMKDFIGARSKFAESFDDLNATDYIYPGWVGL